MFSFLSKEDLNKVNMLKDGIKKNKNTRQPMQMLAVVESIFPHHSTENCKKVVQYLLKKTK